MSTFSSSGGLVGVCVWGGGRCASEQACACVRGGRVQGAGWCGSGGGWQAHAALPCCPWSRQHCIVGHTCAPRRGAQERAHAALLSPAAWSRQQHLHRWPHMCARAHALVHGEVHEVAGACGQQAEQRHGRGLWGRCWGGALQAGEGEEGREVPGGPQPAHGGMLAACQGAAPNVRQSLP